MRNLDEALLYIDSGWTEDVVEVHSDEVKLLRAEVERLRAENCV